MQHHAFAIEAEVEEGITFAQAWVEKGLGMKAKNNPDIVVLRYGLLSVEDARQVSELAAGKAFVSEYKGGHHRGLARIPRSAECASQSV